MPSPFAKAAWIQDPRFDALAPIETFGRFRDAAAVARQVYEQHQRGLSNVHMLLRKSFDLSATAAQATITITADDYYKLWVNGRFVGQGPAAGYPSRHFFNVWDVAKFLRTGRNVIAVHVYYLGMIARVWNSADHRMGMIAHLAASSPVGEFTEVVSDSTWRFKLRGKPTTVTHEDHVRRHSPPYYYEPAFSGGMIAALTQFSENIDAREIDEDWKEINFDDIAWRFVSATDVSLKDYHFEQQPTPPLEHRRLLPGRIEQRGSGHFLIDFGGEVVGTFGMTLPGRDGHVVEILHAEELTSDGAAYVPTRCNCNYREFWTLGDKPRHTLEYFDYKGFRYVEVKGATTALDETNCWVDARHYPWPNNCQFESSDPILNAIWGLCVQSIKWCAQESTVDCPNREKGQYLGDLPHLDKRTSC